MLLAEALPLARVLLLQGRVLVPVPVIILLRRRDVRDLERLLVRLVLVRVVDMLHVLVVLMVEEARVIVLLIQVGLRWTVLLLLLLLLCLLSFSCFECLLGFFELVEYILIVQDGVGEFILEGLALQETTDALLDLRHAENLVDRGPLCRVQLQHGGDQLRRLLGEALRNRREFSTNDFLR